MEDQREDSKARTKDNGVEGVAEKPGSVRDPDIQETGSSYQEVPGEVLEVFMMFLRSVESSPVHGGYQDYRGED